MRDACVAELGSGGMMTTIQGVVNVPTVWLPVVNRSSPTRASLEHEPGGARCALSESPTTSVDARTCARPPIQPYSATRARHGTCASGCVLMS